MERDEIITGAEWFENEFKHFVDAGIISEENYAQTKEYFVSSLRSMFGKTLDELIFRLRLKSEEQAYQKILSLAKEKIIPIDIAHKLILAVRYPDAEITYHEINYAVSAFTPNDK